MIKTALHFFTNLTFFTSSTFTETDEELKLKKSRKIYFGMGAGRKSLKIMLKMYHYH